MNRERQRLSDYLGHIIQASERIASYINDLDEAAFLANPMVQDAVIRNLEIIGEASNNVNKHHSVFAASNPELPLAFAYEMRNAIAHGYFKVDLKIVWKTIQTDLPALKSQVVQIKTAVPDDF